MTVDESVVEAQKIMGLCDQIGQIMLKLEISEPIADARVKMQSILRHVTGAHADALDYCRIIQARRVEP